VEIFATGLGMGESPRWHDDRLWVCDWVAGEVLSFDDTGERRVEQWMTGLPFSVDWLPDGRTVLTSAEGAVVAKPDGSLAPYGTASGQGWNEIVVDPHGNTFINRIGFDLRGGENPKPGYISVIRADGSSREVAGDLSFPNGMAVTPDGGTLVVAESYAHRLTAFDVTSNGGLGNRRVWADLGDGIPDGICLDADGAVWYADVPNRCCVRVAECGEVLERIDVDRGCFACMLGGDGGRTLYVLAATSGARTTSALTSRPARCSRIRPRSRTRVVPRQPPGCPNRQPHRGRLPHHARSS
jgi:sugar lactone lactonase YvrE